MSFEYKQFYRRKSCRIATHPEARRVCNIKRYILNNPVKAGLVNDWRDWKWSWVEPGSEIL